MANESYSVYVDKNLYDVDRGWVTAREILMLANKNPPERFRLFSADSKNNEELGLKQRVDLDQYQPRYFKTLPRDQTEGISAEDSMAFTEMD